MSVTAIVGVVFVAVALSRGLEYFIFDMKKSDRNGTWKPDDNIPMVEMEEV